MANAEGYRYIEPKLQTRQYQEPGRTHVQTGRWQAHPVDRLHQSHCERIIEGKMERPGEDAGLGAYVAYFDTAYIQEGLAADWFALDKKIGFSMKSQMALLSDTSSESVSEWTQKTEYLVKGFALEYLSHNHPVYPCKYQRDPNNPRRLIDPNYGNNDMVEVVSEKERGGSVRESLQELKEYFLNGGDLAVMASPKGPSGLTTDDGKTYEYPDSYFFIMQRNGDTVTNYTVKTDFSHQECREVIFRLTGKALSPFSPIEDYVRALAFIDGTQTSHITSVADVVQVLEQVRSKQGSDKAFADIGWETVYADIAQAEDLYHFNDKAQQLLAEFRAYCSEGNHSKLELQKGLAATILRISKVLLHDQEQNPDSEEVFMQQNEWYKPHRPVSVSYGDVLNEVKQIPGCAGGGEATGKQYMQSVVPSRVAVMVDRYGAMDFECPACGAVNTRPRNGMLKKCKSCGSKKVSCA